MDGTAHLVDGEGTIIGLSKVAENYRRGSSSAMAISHGACAPSVDRVLGSAEAGRPFT